MSMMSSSSDEIRYQLSEYARFVEEVLKPQLEEVRAIVNDVRVEIADYEDLGRRLESLQRRHDQQNTRMESMVDIGYQTIFCNAVAHDTTNVFVNVGMGFHVEMKVDDARDFVKKRISFLKSCKLRAKELKETEIMDHIQSATIILNQLQTELHRSLR